MYGKKNINLQVKYFFLLFSVIISTSFLQHPPKATAEGINPEILSLRYSSKLSFNEKYDLILPGRPVIIYHYVLGCELCEKMTDKFLLSDLSFYQRNNIGLIFRLVIRNKYDAATAMLMKCSNGQEFLSQKIKTFTQYSKGYRALNAKGHKFFENNLLQTLQLVSLSTGMTKSQFNKCLDDNEHYKFVISGRKFTNELISNYNKFWSQRQLDLFKKNNVGKKLPLPIYTIGSTVSKDTIKTEYIFTSAGELEKFLRDKGMK